MTKKRTPNTPIGTCPCPFKGCDEIGSLHKYRQLSDNPALTRHAGRLYMKCPIHGQVQDQEWLLENGAIDATHAAAAAEIAPSMPEPAPEPELAPAPEPEPEPAPEPEPEPAPDPETEDYFF